MAAEPGRQTGAATDDVARVPPRPAWRVPELRPRRPQAPHVVGGPAPLLLRGRGPRRGDAAGSEEDHPVEACRATGLAAVEGVAWLCGRLPRMAKRSRKPGAAGDEGGPATAFGHAWSASDSSTAWAGGTLDI